MDEFEKETRKKRRSKPLDSTRMVGKRIQDMPLPGDSEAVAKYNKHKDNFRDSDAAYGRARRSKNLTELQEEVFLCNEANGWFDEERSVGDEIALLHSEVSEMLEAYRSWGHDDKTQELCQRSHDEDAPAHTCKPEGLGSELADVLIRTLDFAQRHNIDLSYEFNRKMRYNRTRGYRHGGKRL